MEYDNENRQVMLLNKMCGRCLAPAIAYARRNISAPLFNAQADEPEMIPAIAPLPRRSGWAAAPPAATAIMADSGHKPEGVSAEKVRRFTVAASFRLYASSI